MLKGSIYLLAASFCFALSTVFLKIGIKAPYFVTPAFASFLRFFVGFIIFGGYVLLKKESLAPKNVKTVVMRGLTNTIAVAFFFGGIKYTTITKANILNLTYPAFVFIISPLITKEKAKPIEYLFLLIVLAGSWLIVSPDANASFFHINKGDVLCLVSAVIAGFGISYLREAGKYDSSQIILTYQMAIGSVICFFLMLPGFSMPSFIGWIFALAVAIFTAAGQLLITQGYKYVLASYGSVISGSGIFFAAIMGILFFNDPITVNIIIGALLIFISLAGISGLLSKTKRFIPFIDFD